MKRIGLLDLLISVSGRDGDNNRMSSIVPSGAPRTNVRIGRQNVHELSFSFVSPLSPEHDGDRALDRHLRLWASRLVFFFRGLCTLTRGSGCENCPRLDLVDLLVGVAVKRYRDVGGGVGLKDDSSRILWVLNELTESQEDRRFRLSTEMEPSEPSHIRTGETTHR